MGGSLPALSQHLPPGPRHGVSQLLQGIPEYLTSRHGLCPRSISKSESYPVNAAFQEHLEGNTRFFWHGNPFSREFFCKGELLGKMISWQSVFFSDLFLYIESTLPLIFFKRNCPLFGQALFLSFFPLRRAFPLIVSSKCFYSFFLLFLCLIFSAVRFLSNS